MNREWKNHKYYIKIKTGPKSNRYFYSKDEYDAFKKESNQIKGNNQINSMVTKVATNVLNNVVYPFSEILDKKDYIPILEKASNSEKSSWKEKGYKSYKDYKQAICDGKEAIPKKETHIENNKDDIDMDFSSDVISVNAGRFNGNDSIDKSTNCCYCTLALDARRKGYDVVAEDQISIEDQQDIESWYEGDRKHKELKLPNSSVTIKLNNNTTATLRTESESESEKNKQIIIDQFAEYPDESYGSFIVTWKPSGGHSMVWRKTTDITGEPRIVVYDTQTQEQYDMLHFSEIYSDSIDTAAIMRTDDLKFSKKALRKMDYN